MKKALFVLRLAMGWYFFYAGASKLMTPHWSAAGFLKGAASFKSLYAWFALPANIGWVNIVNEWGLFLIGLALIFGFMTRYASIGAIVLMALYYFAGLNFPHAGANGFIIDEHIIYIIIFWIFIVSNVGLYKGLDGRRAKNSK